MDLLKLVEYEIAGSWWVGYFSFAHEWISRYMVWKTRRKLRRYKRYIEIRKRVRLMKSIYGN